MEIIVASIIGTMGSIVAGLLNRPRRQRGEKNGVRDRVDPVVRIIATINTGLGLTLIALILLLSSDQLQDIIKRVDITSDNIVEIRSSVGSRSLTNLPQSTADIKNPSIRRNLDAKSILIDKTGPTEMTDATGRVWGVGEVVYVPKWEWVDLVQTTDPNKKDWDETCGIEPYGKLTIRGFSARRKAALVEYTAPGNTAGTPCESGALFFYPI